MAIETSARARLTVVQPGDGDRGELAKGVGVIFKIDGADAGGALSIVEHTFAVGALVPPHVHTLEDEYSIVIDGEIGFRSDDQEAVLGPGGYIVKPRQQVHAMWNAGTAPARMIEVIAPAGFERFFREFVEITGQRAPTPEEVATLGERYALPFARPAWLPDLIERYELTPPPGM
jgi:quercetin dioxygenase-like cupin family protein